MAAILLSKFLIDPQRGDCTTFPCILKSEVQPDDRLNGPHRILTPGLGQPGLTRPGEYGGSSVCVPLDAGLIVRVTFERSSIYLCAISISTAARSQ